MKSSNDISTKICLILLFIIFGIHLSLFSQPWSYDFGTSTGVHNTNSPSTTFLPQPSSGNDYARVGTQGGSLNLENPGLSSFGTSSELRCVAATGGSYVKFDIYDYPANRTFYIKFSMILGKSDGTSGADVGEWYFFIGDGANYSNGNPFSGSQTFTGIKWVFGTSGAITTSYRNGGAWSTLSSPAPFPLTQVNTYIIEIYGNNSTSSRNYNYCTSQSIAANTWDLWINSTNVGNDLNKALLPDDSNIDSWMFYGGNSVGNVANIFLEDILYSNSLSTTLPIELISFSANSETNKVVLNWTTASEINNNYFTVERSVDAENFEIVKTVSGAGNSNFQINYSATDNNPLSGFSYYRLKQTDFNGDYSYSKIVAVENTSEILSLNILNPYSKPNSINFTISNPNLENLSFEIINTLGEVLISSKVENVVNKSSVVINTKNLSHGIYFIKLSSNKETVVEKVLF